MKLAHTMLKTGSPEEIIEFYREAFDFEYRQKKEMETFTLYFFRAEDQTAEIKPTYNHGEDYRYEKGEASAISPSIRTRNSHSRKPTRKQ